MLTERERGLILDAVDAELTPPGEVAFRALLADSAEAVRFYQATLADARRIRHLPRPAAPPHLADAVFARLSSTLAAELLTRRPAKRPVAAWGPYAVAASLLLAVGAAAFWLSPRPGPENAVVNPPQLSPSVPAAKTLEAVPEAPRLAVLPPEPAVPSPRLSPAPETLSAKAIPSPRPGGGSVVGAGAFVGVVPFALHTARLPLLAGVAEFDRPEFRAAAVAELGHDAVYRLDLFSRDLPRAADEVQAALKIAGVTATVDAQAQERFKKRLPATFAVVVEGLTPAELADLFAELAKQARGEAKSQPALAAGNLFPAAAADARELRDMLGSDLGLWKRPPAPAAAQPIQAGTLREVAASLQKPAKTAFVLATGPTANRLTPATSPELKLYLAKRPERRPAHVPLILTVRPQS